MKAYFLKIHLEVILQADISPCAPPPQVTNEGKQTKKTTPKPKSQCCFLQFLVEHK